MNLDPHGDLCCRLILIVLTQVNRFENNQKQVWVITTTNIEKGHLSTVAVDKLKQEVEITTVSTDEAVTIYNIQTGATVNILGIGEEVTASSLEKIIPDHKCSFVASDFTSAARILLDGIFYCCSCNGHRCDCVACSRTMFDLIVCKM